MKKREEGFTGIEVVVVVIIIFLFISLISSTIYKARTTKKETELKSRAMKIAINQIEQVKMGGFFYYLGKGITQENEMLVENQDLTGEEGFYRTVMVTDYKNEYAKIYPESKNNIETDIVKKVTVRISYRYKGKVNSVELSTVKSKEN